MRAIFLVAHAAMLLGLVGSTSTAQSAEPVKKQGAALLKTDILGVLAHPDDETGVAATLAWYAHHRGAVLANIYCTRGEGGGNMVGTQSGAALGALREAELRDCLATLGVRYAFFLDQLDWAYTESAEATLQKWGKQQTLERLVRLVRALRPEVILTMNPAPTPGQHGHHQSAGILATEAFSAAANPAMFPEQVSKEGLSAWQARRLFYSGAGDPGATIVVTEKLHDGRTPAQIAGAALSHHQSQAFGNFIHSPWLQRPQRFALIKSMVPNDGIEGDLMRGLPCDDSKLAPNVADRTSSPAPLEIRFQPRPAFARYQDWTKEQGIQHAAVRFKADLPMISGEANLLRVALERNIAGLSEGELTLELPPGWQASPRSARTKIAPGRPAQVDFQITPPSGASKDTEITAHWKSVDSPSTVQAVVHPLPKARVPKLKLLPALGAEGEALNALASLSIASSSLAQGKNDGDADSSALVKLAHDGRRIFIEVEVKDDVVVTNIAPNDIRGHWRTDSVEICLDPDAGAEHTMGCFKIGIFPFDLSGRVRAARDADARQGLVEETAPGTRLFSERTAAGYRVQAVIPFEEIGLKKGRKRIGFNVIVYDGDKRDAAVGENINESRIAWAPRPGVMGRPEDWGRLDLE